MWPFQRKQAAQFTRCKQRFLRQSCLKAQFLPPPPGECGGGDGGGGGGGARTHLRTAVPVVEQPLLSGWLSFNVTYLKD